MKKGEIYKIYSREFDNADLNTPKYRIFLGEFQAVEVFLEEGWDEIWIGRKKETGDLHLIVGEEIRGHFGGTAFSAYPIHSLALKELLEER